MKYADVVNGFIKDEAHPAMAVFDFREFDRAVTKAVGPEEDDGPYILERHACARVFQHKDDGEASRRARAGRSVTARRG